MYLLLWTSRKKVKNQQQILIKNLEKNILICDVNASDFLTRFIFYFLFFHLNIIKSYKNPKLRVAIKHNQKISQLRSKLSKYAQLTVCDKIF